MRIIIFSVDDTVSDEKLQSIAELIATQVNAMSIISTLENKDIALIPRTKNDFEEAIDNMLNAIAVPTTNPIMFQARFWELYHRSIIKPEIVDYILKEYKDNRSYLDKRNAHFIVDLCNCAKSIRM